MTTILDLCCGAGLSSDGFARAGAQPRGVDLFPQPDYPYPFEQADALDYLARLDTDQAGGKPIVSLSPPCQAHTRARHLRDAQGGTSRFEDLLTPTLAALRAREDLIWLVENVPGARQLMLPEFGETLIHLCGSMFGLACQRERLFLSNVPIAMPGRCDHSTFDPDPVTGKPRPWGVYHVPGDSIPNGGRTVRDLGHGKSVMGVSFSRSITWAGLKEGIPPAYTEHLARQLLDARKVAA